MKFTFGLLEFSVDDENRLHMDHAGTEKYRAAESASPRSAVELCLDSGSGDWHKKVCTDAESLRYVSHAEAPSDGGRTLQIVLADDRLRVTLRYRIFDGIAAVRSSTSVENTGSEAVWLSYVSGFYYNSFAPAAADALMLCQNGWMQELLPDIRSLADWGIVKGTTSRKISVSNTGTFTTKDYLPIGYLGGLFWQIENNGGWSIEVSNSGGVPYTALSGPCEESGWYKQLAPGASYTTPTCAVGFGDDLTEALGELTKYRRIIKGCNAEYLHQPLIFNDYMHCLGAKPDTPSEHDMIDRAAKAGAEYYCMDAGWYADGGWWDNVGEWQPAQHRFADGLGEVFDYVRSKGMVPGIWLEPEVMGVHCPLAQQFGDDCFYLRRGKRVVNRQRYQLDYRSPTVLAHMNETVDRLIAEYGIGYFKFDYNIDAGVGTERDADSCGDGLEQCRAAFLGWVDALRARYPHVIFENCSSGGMRMNYDMLSRFMLQSTSDNESFVETASIAANASLGVLPEQAGIWVCPLPNMTRGELTYTLVNGMAGVFYLAGRPYEQGESSALLDEAVAVYKSYRAEIQRFLPAFPLGFRAFRDPLHAVAYCGDGKTYLFLWQSETAGEIRLPLAAQRCTCIFPQQNDFAVQTGDALTVSLGDGVNAGVFVLE